jgi:hypothetical protein
VSLVEAITRHAMGQQASLASTAQHYFQSKNSLAQGEEWDMSIILHDGSMALYKQYVAGKAWNNRELLRLNNHRYNEWLHSLNTEETLTGLLQDVGLSQCMPYGRGKSSVRDYVNAAGEVASVVVVKGLHQFEQNWTKAHITIGLDGLLWHLYADWVPGQGNGTMKFGGEITPGPRSTATTHDGFTKVGGKGRGRGR